ncbi:MAG: hypothetical protein QM741_08090 [Rudaea sp.]
MRIFAGDYAGNVAAKNRDLAVTLMDPGDIEPAKSQSQPKSKPKRKTSK